MHDDPRHLCPLRALLRDLWATDFNLDCASEFSPARLDSPGMELGNVYLSKLSKLSGCHARVENSSLDEGGVNDSPWVRSSPLPIGTRPRIFSLSVCGCLSTVTEELSGDTEAI